MFDFMIAITREGRLEITKRERDANQPLKTPQPANLATSYSRAIGVEDGVSRPAVSTATSQSQVRADQCVEHENW